MMGLQWCLKEYTESSKLTLSKHHVSLLWIYLHSRLLVKNVFIIKHVFIILGL